MFPLMWFYTLGIQILLPLCAAAPQTIASPKYQLLPPLREQAALQDAWTEERLSNVPQLLQKYGVDAWLMSQREHAEDTVFWSLKSATQFAARRRTTMLFLANATSGSPSSHTWIDNTPTVWSSLLAVLAEQDPARIAINIHSEIAFSGGLHAGEFGAFFEQLGPKWAKRFVIEPMIAVEFVATMVEGQLSWYRRLQETAWAMISEAFSESVITPGKTTTSDVEWWLREKVQALNYSTWFMPDVTIVDASSHLGSMPSPSVSTTQQHIINYGDLLHVDFGVTALGLNTDIQHLAYVLHPGETESDIPQGLLDGLKKANRMQDIVRENMEIGVSGNEILERCLAQMEKEGIVGKVYSHPIGDWGHSAGTLIGMTNLQAGVPVLGEIPLLNSTYYSVELYAEHFVPKHNANLNFYLEEDVYSAASGEDSTSWEWVWGRQEKFHLIRSTVDNSLNGLRVQYLE